MQTKLIQTYQVRDVGQEAEVILRACVHCGFCNATCPTYQVLGDELDGPRGRIYQIKQLLEGQPVSEETRLHLDRCLTCRACETTCPSGVEYGRLLDIGRKLVTEQVPRGGLEKGSRNLLLRLFSKPWLFGFVLRLGWLFKPILPSAVRSKIPAQRKRKYAQSNTGVLPKEEESSTKKVLVLEGCVQNALDPNVNDATRVMLTKLGFSFIGATNVGCCGAMSFHLDEVTRAKEEARHNIDAWWPHIEKYTVEAIVVNASGCGVFVKDYVHLLKDDVMYSEKARRISELTKDPIELLVTADWRSLQSKINNAIAQRGESVVFHPPCTLQHGQKLAGQVESLFEQLGIALEPLRDSHLCCGSAGTYSIFQSGLSEELKIRKLAAIKETKAKVVLSANIGCQTHLSSGDDVTVIHWLDYLSELLSGSVN